MNKEIKRWLLVLPAPSNPMNERTIVLKLQIYIFDFSIVHYCIRQLIYQNDPGIIGLFGNKASLLIKMGISNRKNIPFIYFSKYKYFIYVFAISA